MKINELREELDARGLSSKGTQLFPYFNVASMAVFLIIILFEGLKPQLQARLQKAIKSDASSGANATEETDTDGVEMEKEVEEVVVPNEPETTVIDDHEDNVHSNDGIDIDMADIIVIDEYDSTKKERKSRKKVYGMAFKVNSVNSDLIAYFEKV